MPSFAEQIAAFAKKTNQTTENAIQAACMQLTESIVMLTPVDKGRARNNWIPTINAPGSGTTEATDKTGASVLNRAKVVVKNAPGNIFYLVNNLPYIRVLEYGEYPNPGKPRRRKINGKWVTAIRTTEQGFSIQASRGMVRISVRRFKAALERAIK